MSSEDARARPIQVTVACWTVVVSSVLVVLAVFEAMGNLTSVDMRDRVTEALSEGAGGGLGISVDEALEVIRWSLYVAGVAAVVTGVLAVYVLRRDRVARIVLSVAAVPIVLTSPMAGSLPGMIVGAGAALLWTRPARDWFAGRPITPAPQRSATRAAPPEPPPSTPVPVPGIRGPEGDDQPPPTPAWGAPPPRLDFPAPSGPPVLTAWAPPSGPPVPDPGAAGRPRQIRVACLATWVGTAVSALGALLLLLMALVARDTLIEAATSDPRWDGTDTDLIVPAVAVFAGVVLFWCAGNAVLAWFVWGRHRAAWIGLVVSVAFAAGVSLIAFPASLVHLAALAATLGLLASAPSRAWFRPAGPPSPSGPVPPR